MRPGVSRAWYIRVDLLASDVKLLGTIGVELAEYSLQHRGRMKLPMLHPGPLPEVGQGGHSRPRQTL
jgi:hypothetical protein